MDNRLDFVNNTSKHLETLTEDDTLLVISHNKKQGDLFFGLFGDWENISIIMSNKDAVNHDGDSKELLEEIKKLILNTAVNICKENPETLNTMLKGLGELKKNEDKLIVIADENGYVQCPFCKEKHKHGKAGGNGYRLPDCTAILINNPVSGKHYKKDGYYVMF